MREVFVWCFRHNRLVTFAVVALVIILFAGPVWAIEQVPASEITSAQNLDETSPLISDERTPSSQEESCAHLLKAIRYASSYSDTDRVRRSAGAAAAVGLVFGIRFALGPKTVTSSKRPALGVWQPDSTSSSKALAVADYRRCKNNEALEALNQEWRWQR